MWAPDCINRNGKYYFYFPTTPKDSTNGKGFTIGVAVADQPTGPFVPQPLPIKNVRGIDPNVFIDKDGQPYLYWSQGNIYGAKLQASMLELATEPQVLGALPEKGLKEGPYLFERNGIYYLTYPHVANKTERLEYAMGTTPLGPFKFAGVLMDESPTGCWTNHHSITQFKNQWYLFYHHNDLSPGFDKNRSIRVDSLFFNPDGTIRKVQPTLRGVGLTDAKRPIQLDRYSQLSSRGATIAFLDTLNKFQGWQTALAGGTGWVTYNRVDFGRPPLKTVVVRAQAATAATLQLRLDGASGPVLARVAIAPGKGWQEVKAVVTGFKPGVHNLFAAPTGRAPVAVDWVRFE
ncbi:MAG: carbohydrate-binding protein, partial [Cytophagaceae bacterium]